MENKIENKKMLSKEEIQKRINLVFTAALDVYDLLPYGVTVEVSIPTKQEIIIPNQQPEIKTLLITKPNQMLRIHPE